MQSPAPTTESLEFPDRGPALAPPPADLHVLLAGIKVALRVCLNKLGGRLRQDSILQPPASEAFKHVARALAEMQAVDEVAAG